MDDLNLDNVHDTENIWLEIKSRINACAYIIGGIYRHLNQHEQHFITGLENTLNIISRQNKTFIIAGDMNIDLTKFNIDSKTKEYLQRLLANSCLPQITLPTRITTRTATLIDHIIYSIQFNSIQYRHLHAPTYKISRWRARRTN